MAPTNYIDAIILAWGGEMEITINYSEDEGCAVFTLVVYRPQGAPRIIEARNSDFDCAVMQLNNQIIDLLS